MTRMRRAALLALLVSTPAMAQQAPAPTSRADPPTPTYTPIGKVKPRSALEMRERGITSPFTIGTETTDRDFSIYDNWRKWLGPLGIPNARVQTGWHDIEKTPGVFDFAKLDHIVRGMKADGVQPWMDLNYGNPLYPGGGQAALSGGLPVIGSEGYEKWKEYVRRTVRHFARGPLKVTEWQIWNEPDGGPNKAADYVTLAVDTARIVKEEQPEARLLIGAFTGAVPGSKTEYALEVIRSFKTQTGDSIPSRDIDVVYHPYSANPDESYARLDPIRAVVSQAGYGFRQGENGTNSQRQPHFALRDHDWTETSQAKWALRRVLGDFHYGVKTNLFTFVDLHYDRSKNNKGLLLTGEWNPNPPTRGDQTVKRPKVAYRAVQAMAAIFDDRLKPVPNAGCTAPAGYTVHAYARGSAGKLLAVWRNTDRPGAAEQVADIDLTCTGFAFGKPKQTYTDLIDGSVYAVGKGVVTRAGKGVAIKGLRTYDSPVLLADDGLVTVTR